MLIALLTAASLSIDKGVLADFRKYFRKYKDTPSRVEAVMALDREPSPEVVELLVPVLDDDDPDVARAAKRVLGSLPSAGAIEALRVALDEAKKPDEQGALLEAVQLGGYESARPQVEQLLGSSSADVRRSAIGALVQVGGPETAGLIRALCEDKDDDVRCAALDGLAALRSKELLAPALEALEDKEWRVRASAIAALGKVRDKSSIGPLIERMQVEEGRLITDIAGALESLTAKRFGVYVEDWVDFWGRVGDRFEIPTDAELATLKAALEARARKYEPGQVVDYHGIESTSEGILFLVDISGSMNDEVVERERFAHAGYPSFRKMDVVATELARTIARLDSSVRFNIYAFATEIRPWKKKLTSASSLNKSNAQDWVMGLEPMGIVNSAAQAAGLVPAGSREAGRTNTYGVLMEALGGGVTRAGARGVDTIFFCSDGLPSTGRFIDPVDIMDEVLRVNKTRRIVIHTIALGPFRKDFMEELAELNGGIFIDLGK